MPNIFQRLIQMDIRSTLIAVVKRFPLSVIIVLAITALLLYVVNKEVDDVLYQRLWLTGIVTFFLATGVALFTETWKRQPFDKVLLLLPILYGVLFYSTLEIRDNLGVQSFTYFLLHLTGFVSLLYFAPFITRMLTGREASIEYTNYFTRIAWILLMSAIVGVSLLILGFIALYAVTSLFDIFTPSTESKLYGNWAVLAFALIAPLYGLVQIPQIGDVKAREYETNNFFSFLVRYIATPAIFVYFTILYAYSAQVLMNFSDWPKGIISWLVIGFSSFGYLTYIFSKPYEDSGIVSWFRRYFPYVVIPQIAMLAYAIYLRISQYDLTMNRYFVVIFGLWLAGISLYYIISRRHSLVVIPASLTILSLLISIGPWSVFSYPQARQETRLLQHLTTANILQSGKIVPLASEHDVSKELSTEIAAGIEYLCSFDECTRVKEIFPEQTARAEAQAQEDWNRWNKDNTGSTYQGASYWDIQRGIITELKVQRYPYDDTTHEFAEPEYLNYNVDPQYGQFPLDVRGYDHAIQVMSDSE